MHTDSRELHTAAADDLAVRLAAVASRALITRRARGMDWGPYGDRVEVMVLDRAGGGPRRAGAGPAGDLRAARAAPDRPARPAAARARRAPASLTAPATAVLRALAAGDRDAARGIAGECAGDALCAALAAHLDRPPGDGVYDEADAFALHAVAPEERRAALGALARRSGGDRARRVRRPGAGEGTDAHPAHLAQRYALGVAEYRDHPEVVAGFLMPVLVTASR